MASTTRTAQIIRKQIEALLGPFVQVGDVYFLDSATGSDKSKTTATGANAAGWGQTPEFPFATLDYAFSQCTANNGDVIIIFPGHSEDEATAAALAEMDVAGVRVIGAGQGDDRPLFTFNHASADINVTAANCSIENCVFKASTADVVHCFDVTAKHFTCRRCTFLDDAATDNFLDYFDASSTSNNNADGLSIIENEFYSDDTGNDGVVEVNADLDRLRFDGNLIFMGVASEAVITAATGKDLTFLSVQRNQVYRLNTDTALLITVDTTVNSGLVAYNVVGHADTQTEILVTTTGGFRTFQNFATALESASGYLLPAADS